MEKLVGTFLPKVATQLKRVLHVFTKIFGIIKVGPFNYQSIPPFKMDEEISLTFAGCGFLALYYGGVGVCLKKYVPHLKFKHVSGASAGSFAACAVLCDVQPEEFIGGMCEMIGSARKRMLGPFTPTYSLTKALRKQLGRLYPEDAHVRVSGRLRVSMTRVSDGRNFVVDRFESKEELIQCLLASSFIPVFSGMVPPKIHGVRFMDGMFSDNVPCGEEPTITVSPFCGETDICPRYDAMTIFHVTISNTSFAVSYPNLLKLRGVVWPPTAKELEALSKQGFEDTVRYLYANKYVHCTRCVPLQPNCADATELGDEPQRKCCEATLQEAIEEGLPDSILAVYQHYIDSETNVKV